MDHNRDADEAHRLNVDALAEGYRQMAADIEREREAAEWVEALIGDAYCVDQEPAL